MSQQLSLTPFEEYMYVDRHPAYPMSCFLKLTFRGRPNLGTLERALEKVLGEHLLLACRVAEDSRGRFHWEKSDRPVNIQSERLPEGKLFPRSSGIDLSRCPALKISSCEETRKDLTSLIFEIHHSACDAAGLDRFVVDLLTEYAMLRTGRDFGADRIPIDPETNGTVDVDFRSLRAESPLTGSAIFVNFPSCLDR